MHEFDAVIVGSGPNGLAAAVTLARAGLKVCVIERDERLGGGARTDELTLPGFHHDVCSAVHPMALQSEFFRAFELAKRINLHVPDVSFAHPLDDGRAALAYRDLNATAAGLGADGVAYERLMRPFVDRADAVAALTSDSLFRVPHAPLVGMRLALAAVRLSGTRTRPRFAENEAPALLAGAAAHSILPLEKLETAAAGLVLATFAHARGWAVPVGGSGAITRAMIEDLTAHGATIVTGVTVSSLDELPSSRVVLLDVSARAAAAIAPFPNRYRRALNRMRYGNAIAKVDFALSDPVPWAHPEVGRASTMHVGGSRAEVAASENAVARGGMPASPFVLASQPTTFDPTRAPQGRHVLWTYTHVPRGSDDDRTEAVTAQIERFAPGFRDTILASASRTALEVEAHNPNYVGGDISAGEMAFDQLVRRPVASPDPWRTPLAGVYLCSASTSPGPGVHGMAGWRAALSALRHEFGVLQAPDLSFATNRSE